MAFPATVPTASTTELMPLGVALIHGQSGATRVAEIHDEIRRRTAENVLVGQGSN